MSKVRKVDVPPTVPFKSTQPYKPALLSKNPFQYNPGAVGDTVETTLNTVKNNATNTAKKAPNNKWGSALKIAAMIVAGILTGGILASCERDNEFDSIRQTTIIQNNNLSIPVNTDVTVNVNLEGVSSENQEAVIDLLNQLITLIQENNESTESQMDTIIQLLTTYGVKMDAIIGLMADMKMSVAEIVQRLVNFEGSLAEVIDLLKQSLNNQGAMSEQLQIIIEGQAYSEQQRAEILVAIANLHSQVGVNHQELKAKLDAILSAMNNQEINFNQALAMLSNIEALLRANNSKLDTIIAKSVDIYEAINALRTAQEQGNTDLTAIRTIIQNMRDVMLNIDAGGQQLNETATEILDKLNDIIVYLNSLNENESPTCNCNPEILEQILEAILALDFNCNCCDTDNDPSTPNEGIGDALDGMFGTGSENAKNKKVSSNPPTR